MLPISILHAPRDVSSVALTISSISLASNPTDIWRYLFGNEPLPEAWKGIESISISNLDKPQFSQVDVIIRNAYGQWQPENIQAYSEMGYRFSMYGYLSTRRYKLFHAECLGDRERPKCYDTLLLQCRHVYDLFSQQKGEMIPHFAVAMPLVLFATEILNVDKKLLSIQMDTAGYSAFGGTKPKILLTDNMCRSNVMCVEVKASADEIDAAWEEAIGASMLLDSRTGFSTVVMAQAGNIIRIALLTILKSASEPAQDTAKANTSSESDMFPVMRNYLPPLIKDALDASTQQFGIVPLRSVPPITRGDVRLWYGIEFDATALNSAQFVAALRRYFEYILRPIRYCLTHQQDLLIAVVPHKENVKECYIGSNHFRCKLMRKCDGESISSIHEKVGLPLDAFGSVKIQHTDKFGINRDPIIYMRHSWFEGRKFEHYDIEGRFIKLCDAVVELHEKGIVHCDICRPNVIVNRCEEKVVLIDYKFAMQIRGQFNPPENIKTSFVFKQFLNFISSDKLEGDFREASQLIGSKGQLRGCLFDIYAMIHFVYFGYDIDHVLQPKTAVKVVKTEAVTTMQGIAFQQLVAAGPAATDEEAVAVEQTAVITSGIDAMQAVSSPARKRGRHNTTSASLVSTKRQKGECSPNEKIVLELIDTNIEYATFVHGCVTAIIELSNKSVQPAQPTRALMYSIMRSVLPSLS